MHLRGTQQPTSRWLRYGMLALMLMLVGLAMAGCSNSDSNMDAPDGTRPTTGATQALQRNQTCKMCHERQYQETIQSVKSGYRAISPAFNALELAGNFLVQASLEAGAIGNNLRPVYAPEGENMVSAVVYDNADEARSAFCIGCHDGAIILRGETGEREIPTWQGRYDPEPPDADHPPTEHPVIRHVRPLRDFHFVNAAGEQVLPAVAGGPPPLGALPSLGSQGVSCDHCHNVQGPALQRSFMGDGFANAAQELEFTRIKVGPFDNALPVGPLPDGTDGAQNFHAASGNSDRIKYLRSSLFCISCHDVRVPSANLLVPEGNAATPDDITVPYFRLENLGTEWTTQAYAFPDRNPLNQKVRCQDCHMSLYPFADTITYTVNDPESGIDFPVTSPRPAVFPVNKAAVSADVSVDVTGVGLAVPDRNVVTHYLTGIDVPFAYTDCADAAAHGRTDECIGELRERLGSDRVSAFAEGMDVHHTADGTEVAVPLALQTRRETLLKASTRLYLNLTDDTATLGETFHARVTAIALTGHNFPAGFSQERTAWIEINVTAPLSEASAGICDDTQFVRVAGESQFCDRHGDFILYQSGYRIDRPHPETGEMAPDGNLDDEDTSHLIAVVNPLNHHNEIFYEGPDAGPLERIFFGEPKGLVLFRNELLRLYGPACLPLANATAAQRGSCPEGMTATDIPATNRRHPRTGEVLKYVIEEETFSAGAANAVDNWRSIPPLDPQTYVYELKLPTEAELADEGIVLAGPLRVRAVMHFLHFPPLFLRFLARVGGSIPYALPPAPDDRTAPYHRVADFDQLPQNGYTNAVGLRGPANHDFRLFDEKRIDDLVRNIPDIAEVEQCIPLGNFTCPDAPQAASAASGRAAYQTVQRNVPTSPSRGEQGARRDDER